MYSTCPRLASGPVIDPFFYLAFINQLRTKVSVCVFNQYLTLPLKSFFSSKNMVAMGISIWVTYYPQRLKKTIDCWNLALFPVEHKLRLINNWPFCFYFCFSNNWLYVYIKMKLSSRTLADTQKIIGFMTKIKLEWKIAVIIIKKYKKGRNNNNGGNNFGYF